MVKGLCPAPTSAELQFLRGWEVTQVCLGSNDVIFRFVQPGHIHIGGEFEHVTRTGMSYRPDLAGNSPAAVFLHELCGQTIENAQSDIEADTVTITFSEGSVIRILSEGLAYERALIAKVEHYKRPEDVIVF